MKPISSLLGNSLDSINVNSNDKYINTVNNSDNVNDELDKFLEEKNIKPEGIAIKLSEDLSDLKSISYYNILVKENRNKLDIILDSLSLTKEADSQGKIRTNKAAYFLGILRRKGITVKFKKK